MKKSALVTFGVIMSALILCSCGEERRCVDANGVVVDDEKCKEADKRRTGGSYGGSHGGGFYWYYGGSGRGLGSKVSGGSFSSVSRGGFGHLAAAHGSGHS
jgi:hypothetical protein